MFTNCSKYVVLKINIGHNRILVSTDTVNPKSLFAFKETKYTDLVTIWWNIRLEIQADVVNYKTTNVVKIKLDYLILTNEVWAVNND